MRAREVIRGATKTEDRGAGATDQKHSERRSQMRSGSGKQDAERQMKKDNNLTLDDQWKNLNQGNAETCHHNHVTEIKTEYGPYGEERSKTERSEK